MVAEHDDADQWDDVDDAYGGVLDDRYRWFDMLRAITGNALSVAVLLALLAAIPVAFTVINENTDAPLEAGDGLNAAAVIAADAVADGTEEEPPAEGRPDYVAALAPYLSGAANPLYVIAVGPGGVHRITGPVANPRITRFDAPAGAADPTLPAPERTATGVTFYTMRDEALMRVTMPLDGSGPTLLATVPSDSTGAERPLRQNIGPRAASGLRAIPQPAGGIVVTTPDGASHPLSDLPAGSVTDVTWAGGGTAVIVTLETGGSGSSGLWLCDLRQGCSQLVAGAGVRMAR